MLAGQHEAGSVCCSTPLAALASCGALKIDGFWLVSWCFKPSQPQRILSGLRETFVKRCIAERTNKAETKSGEQSEKAESGREKLWNEIQLKGL